MLAFDGRNADGTAPSHWSGYHPHVRTIGARSFAKGPAALQREILGEGQSDVMVDMHGISALTSDRFAALACAARRLAERGFQVFVAADRRYDKVLAIADLPIVRI
jgi:hypothetical protein